VDKDRVGCRQLASDEPGMVKDKPSTRGLVLLMGTYVAPAATGCSLPISIPSASLGIQSHQLPALPPSSEVGGE